MQKFFILLLSFVPGLYAGAQTLTGTVTDSSNNRVIEGVSVIVPKLKLGAVTDAKGNYKISPLPKGTYTVEIQMIGYSLSAKQVAITGDTKLDFAITLSSINLKEVVITSLGNSTILRRAPVPVTAVSHDMLFQQASSNVVDAIAQLPGLAQVTTGPGVSKPEINGLGYNRVLTLMDGERQEDFQWGDEHGILIDPYAVYSAEIIRGPASLQYGANAVAGVVSFKSEPLPDKKGTVQGSVQSEYQTNNGLIGSSFDLAGNSNGIKWDVRGSYEAAHSYWDPHDGYVWGTAYTQDNIRGVVEMDKSWGYSRFSVSTLHRQIEIPDGNRDSASGRFEFDVPLNAQYVNGNYVPGSGKIYPTLGNFLSYNPNIAGYQVLDHDEAWWQNSINVGGRGKVGIDIGYTQSIRHEIDTGSVGQENMIVHDIPYSIKYQTEEGSSGIKITTGFNGIYEFENNYPEPPAPYVGDYEIPNYHIFDIGGYGIAERDFDKLTISGGLRYDFRSITGQPMYLANYDTPDQQQVPTGTPGAYTQFSAFSHTYTGFSGSIGASYQLPQHYYVKINVAKSYRAPAINELTGNELDPANVFKLGDPNLQAEQGFEIDAAIGKNAKDVAFEIDGFYNHISHFIFADRIAAADGSDSMQLGAPVYKYTSNSAIITGITASLKVHPESLKWLEWDNGFTYIYSFLPGQTDSTQHVPYTPAPRLTSQLKFKITERHPSFLGGTFFEIGLAKYWAQNDIYSALYNELPSLGYTLYNLGLGTNFVNDKTHQVICTLFVECTNLMNISYIDHTSRPQYFWAYNSVENPTNFGSTAAVVTQRNQGIYNMGRNIGLKAIFPFGGHKITDTELHGYQ